MHGRNMGCCGWDELVGLSYWRSAAIEVKRYLTNYRPGNRQCGAVLFTENTNSPSYATKFAAFVKKNDLGTVVELPKFTNPNTSHKITSFVWILNHAGIHRYKTGQPKRRKKSDAFKRL